MNTAAFDAAPAGKPLRAALWIAQVLVTVAFCGAGFAKLTTPIPELSQTMTWTAQYPLAFVRTMGAIDIAGGLGILLPFLTRIKPNIGVLAALCCVVLQICAIVFHLSRHEVPVIVLNLILLPLCIFVLWGRTKRAPILPRT